MPEVLEATEQVADTRPDETLEREPIADVQSGDGGNQPDVQSGLDEGLVSLARDYGFDPDKWKANPAELERAVTEFDRLYSHHARQLSQPPKQDTPAKETAPTAAGLKRFELAIKALEDANEFDPKIVQFTQGVVQTLQQMNEHYHGQIEAYEKRFGELSPYQQKVEAIEQFMQAQEAQRRDQQLDDAFEKLGPEYSDLYGKGSMSSLKPMGLTAQNRNEVAKAFAEIQHMDAMAGRRMTFESQFKRAVQLTHGDKFPTIERRKLAMQAHALKNSALSRPASKTGAPLDDESAVVAKLKEWKARVDV